MKFNLHIFKYYIFFYKYNYESFTKKSKILNTVKLKIQIRKSQLPCTTNKRKELASHICHKFSFETLKYKVNIL